MDNQAYKIEGDGTRRTHFGFQYIDEAEKGQLVRDLFNAVAPQYDLMNDIMSGGIHRLWKEAVVDWLLPRPGMSLLDVAGGTGDVSFRFIDRITKKLSINGKIDKPVTVCDISTEMVTVGRDRALDRGMVGDLFWICGNAENLPFDDCKFDAVTFVFGLRNVTYPDRALKECRRVLKPGGHFICLEFSHVVLPLLDRLYSAYSFGVVPWLGEVVAGNRDAYQYLVESIKRFPPQDKLAWLMSQANFSQVRVRNLSGGIAAIHSGWRI